MAKTASAPTVTSPVAIATPRRNRDMPPASRVPTDLPHSLVDPFTCAFAQIVDAGYRPGNFGASVVKPKGRYNRFTQFQLVHYDVAIPARVRDSRAIIALLSFQGSPSSWPHSRTGQREPERRHQAGVRENAERPYFSLIQVVGRLRGVARHVGRRQDRNNAIPAAGTAHRASAAINHHDVPLHFGIGGTR